MDDPVKKRCRVWGRCHGSFVRTSTLAKHEARAFESHRPGSVYHDRLWELKTLILQAVESAGAVQGVHVISAAHCVAVDVRHREVEFVIVSHVRSRIPEVISVFRERAAVVSPGPSQWRH